MLRGQDYITVIEVGATACDVASSFNIISVRPNATIGIKSSEKTAQILFLGVSMLDLIVISMLNGYSNARHTSRILH